ncbi:Hypothetical protein FKW44_013416, partial [Caligus rogercresseyi]
MEGTSLNDSHTSINTNTAGMESVLGKTTLYNPLQQNRDGRTRHFLKDTWNRIVEDT